MIFTNQEKRPLPDRVLSRPYHLGKDKGSPQLSAISIACNECLHGQVTILRNMLSHQIIGQQMVNMALSDLALEEVPIELFHPNLLSLSLSGNKLTRLPPVERWSCQKLTSLNLANNQFPVVPPGMFLCPKLTTLNISSNDIMGVDLDIWSAPSLKYLYLSSNFLRSLPIPILDRYDMSLRPCDLSSPGTTSRDICHSLRHSFIDVSTEREEDFHKMHLGYNLEFLDLSDNNLTSIPKGLPCLAPMLMTLKLNQNKITKFGSVSDYPTLLRSLNLSNNNARFGIEPALSHERVCLQSQPDQRTRCNHCDHSHLINLQHLNLSKNQLQDVALETRISSLMPLPHPSSTSYDHTLLYPKLQSVFLNDNVLVRFPEGIHKQERLGTLDISGNIHIKELPQKLHRLKNLIGFRYQGIGDPITGTLDTFKDTAQLLYYLRARELQ